MMRSYFPRRTGQLIAPSPGRRRIVGIAGLTVTSLVFGVIVVIRADQSPAPHGAPPTFAADIAPIVYGNCVTCHRPGQAAPFSLLTYADVRKHGEDLADVTADRYMPPWHASRAEGFPEFVGERFLKQSDIDTIQAWVTAGMPGGDLKHAPAPPVFAAGWPLGTPDLVLRLPAPVSVAAEGPDQYRNILLPIDLPDDRWVTAIDYQPSARSVVHHALYFTAPAGSEVRDTDAVPGLGASALASPRAGVDGSGGLGGWVPGVTPRFMPEGIAQPLPKRTDFVLQLHLHPSGRMESENGVVAVYFAKTPPVRSFVGVQVPPAFGIGAAIDIPPDESRYSIHDAFQLPVDVEAFGVRGHAHYLCREMKMVATLPDGSTRGLLWIKDWDFNWQDSYLFKTGFALPKGTRISTDLVYDNSVDNVHNPNSPPRRVRWGRESSDEMGSMTLLVTTTTADEGKALRTALLAHLRDQVVARMRRR